MGLLNEVDENHESFFIDSLNPLAKVCDSILTYSVKDYTSDQWEDLVRKINEISKRSVINYLALNEDEVFLRWIKIAIQSAGRYKNLKGPTFEILYEVLESDKKEIINYEQIFQIRKMVLKAVNSHNLSEQEKRYANAILEQTQLQVLFIRMLFNWLEKAPDDIKQIELMSYAALMTIYKSPFLLTLLIGSLGLPIGFTILGITVLRSTKFP